MSILSSYIFGRNPNGFVLKLLGNLKHNINNMKQYVHEFTHSLNFKKKFICKNCLLVQMHLVVYTAYKCIDYYTKWITFVCTNWFSLPLTFIERLGIKCKHVFFHLSVQLFMVQIDFLSALKFYCKINLSYYHATSPKQIVQSMFGCEEAFKRITDSSGVSIQFV